MFKVYGVSRDENDDSTGSMIIRPISESGEDRRDLIEEDIADAHVRTGDAHETDTDIGQIAVDVLDMPESIIIVAPIAGVDVSDMNIGLSRNILTLSGTREIPAIYRESKRMLVEECFYGDFSRSIILPENLGFDKIEASVDNNVIYITIPKLTLITKSVKIKK